MFKVHHLVIPIILLIFFTNTIKTQTTHKACLKWLKNTHTPYLEEKQALLCGASLGNPHKRSLLARSGLIHIFVVSGAHIQFYKKLFQLIFGSYFANGIISILLPLYCLICNGSPPILRACAFFYANLFNSKLKLNLLSTELSFISGLVCVLFNLNNIFSTSLLLSWTCALIIQNKSIREKSFFIHLMIAPILLLFCLPNPLVLIPSFLLSSLISLIILPIPFLTIISPSTFGFVFTSLFKSLEIFTNEIPLTYFNSSVSRALFLASIWLYLILINLYLIRDELK